LEAQEPDIKKENDLAENKASHGFNQFIEILEWKT
jgi:hypothetical protein